MISGRAASECTDTWHKPAKEASTNYTLSASKGHSLVVNKALAALALALSQ